MTNKRTSEEWKVIHEQLAKESGLSVRVVNHVRPRILEGQTLEHIMDRLEEKSANLFRHIIQTDNSCTKWARNVQKAHIAIENKRNNHDARNLDKYLNKLTNCRAQLALAITKGDELKNFMMEVAAIKKEQLDIILKNV